MQYYKRKLTGKRSFSYHLTFTQVACYVYDHEKSNTCLYISIVVKTVFSRLINQKVHSSSTFNYNHTNSLITNQEYIQYIDGLAESDNRYHTLHTLVQ